MKVPVAITDLTRMQGRRVCIAGYRPGDTCIRPVFRHGGLMEDWLYDGGELVVRPFAVVELDVLEPRPEPPHTEDWIVDPDYRVRCGLLSPERRRALLARISDPDVESIFGAPLERGPGWYILAGDGQRSLGTIMPRRVERVFFYRRETGEWSYHLEFVDRTGQHYKLGVTDLAFRCFLEHLHVCQGKAPPRAAQRVTTALQQAQVFLRIGLARHWEKYPDRCYLQITGVYSFPDYLDGRCFADFDLTATTPPATTDDLPF